MGLGRGLGRVLARRAACQGQVFSNWGARTSQKRREQRAARRSPEGPTSTLDVRARERGRLLLSDGPQGSSPLLLLVVVEVLRRFRRGGGDQGGREARQLGGRARERVEASPLNAPAIRQRVRTVVRRSVHPIGAAQLHHRHSPHGHPRRKGTWNKRAFVSAGIPARIIWRAPERARGEALANKSFVESRGVCSLLLSDYVQINLLLLIPSHRNCSTSSFYLYRLPLEPKKVYEEGQEINLYTLIR